MNGCGDQLIDPCAFKNRSDLFCLQKKGAGLNGISDDKERPESRSRYANKVEEVKQKVLVIDMREPRIDAEKSEQNTGTCSVNDRGDQLIGPRTHNNSDDENRRTAGYRRHFFPLSDVTSSHISHNVRCLYSSGFMTSQII